MGLRECLSRGFGCGKIQTKSEGCCCITLPQLTQCLLSGFSGICVTNKIGGSLLGHIQRVGLGGLQARGESSHSNLETPTHSSPTQLPERGRRGP